MFSLKEEHRFSVVVGVGKRSKTVGFSCFSTQKNRGKTEITALRLFCFSTRELWTEREGSRRRKNFRTPSPMHFLMCIGLGDRKGSDKVSCYSPMLAVPAGINNKTGKVFYSFREKFIDSGQLSEVKLMPDGKYYQVKVVPCGKCIGCRLDYARQWAIRCSLEMEDYSPEECKFVTLTYDDLNVPEVFLSDDKVVYNPVKDPIEHKITFVQQDVVKHQTLLPAHLKEFLKRLRSSQLYNYGKKFRFYACGEYGSKSFRPHYHIILFGVKLPEPAAGTWQSARSGFRVYEDKYLEKIWKKGNVIVGQCTYDSIGYVARYMLKKQKGDDRFFYDVFHIVAPFTRMSLKPGIGLRYYDKHKDEIYKEDLVRFSTEKRGITINPPKYFDKKYEEEYPNLFKDLKEKRGDKAILSMVAKENSYGLPYSKVLEIERMAKVAQTKILEERNVLNE